MTEDDLAGYMLKLDGKVARLKVAKSETKPDGDGRVRHWVTVTIAQNSGDQDVEVMIEANAVLLLARMAAQELATMKGSKVATVAGEAVRGVVFTLERGASGLLSTIEKVFTDRDNEQPPPRSNEDGSK